MIHSTFTSLLQREKSNKKGEKNNYYMMSWSFVALETARLPAVHSKVILKSVKSKKYQIEILGLCKQHT